MQYIGGFVSVAVLVVVAALTSKSGPGGITFLVIILCLIPIMIAGMVYSHHVLDPKSAKYYFKWASSKGLEWEHDDCDSGGSFRLSCGDTFIWVNAHVGQLILRFQEEARKIPKQEPL